MARVCRVDTAPAIPADDEAPTPPASARRVPKSNLGMFAASMAFLLPVAFSPTLFSPFWSARLALVLLVAAVGLPRLVVLVARRDGAALAATAFLLVAAAATLAAHQPALSFWGPYGSGAGFVLVGGIAGAWAIGRSLDRPAVADVGTALVAALLVNVVVALAQDAFGLKTLGLTAPAGAYGLLGNPVHLGALLAGGFALLAARFPARPLLWGPVVAAGGAALQFSGSRLGLVALVVVGAASVLRWPPARAAALAACLAAGFFGGLLLDRVLPDHTPSTRNVVQKLEAASESELYDRAHNWDSGVRALADRPLLGYGPGRVIEATSPRRDARMARGDPERVFLDAHNLLVEYLVTTGPLGLLALVAFLVLALRRARGPLLWFALGILALHLMQPQSPATTPLAFLALGAAAVATTGPVGAPRHPLLAVGTGALALAALVGGGRIVAGDFQLDQADLDTSIAKGRSAARLLSSWPEPAARLGLIHAFYAVTERSDPARRAALQEESLRWFLEATRRDPAVANHWNNLAEFDVAAGRLDAAETHFRAALARNPWSANALTGVAAMALRRGDTAAAAPLIEQARRVLPAAAVDTLLARRGARPSP